MPRTRRAVLYFVRPPISFVAIAALALAASLPVHAQGVQGGTLPIETEKADTAQTVNSEQLRQLPLNSDEFGAGAYRLLKLTPGGQPEKWQDFDAKGTLREDGIIQYNSAPGSAQKIEETRDYYRGGRIDGQSIFKWNTKGWLDSYEVKSFDPHGVRTSDHITDYKFDMRVENNWYKKTNTWETNSIPYNPAPTPKAAAAQPGTSMAAPSATQTETVGLLFPRDYHAGDMLTGSLWKSSYAEAFKTVPGLSEYSFPIQTYDLPNGMPSWSGLEIGVKGDGYIPVQSNGEFSLHVPMDWKGPLVLQAREPDGTGLSGSSYSNLQIGDPMAAPAMPQNLVPAKLTGFARALAIANLIDLWNEAYDLELEFSDAEDNGASDGMLDDIDGDLGEVYDDIDYVTSLLPESVVVNLAHDLADETRAINEELRKDTLTEDQEAELGEYDGWANFLDDEANERTSIRIGSLVRADSLYWTSPVLSQGRLGALRGPLSGDDYGNEIRLDNMRVPTVAETPNAIYFMPPDGLSAGMHNFQIGGYGTPQTTLPIFYMTLTMWADATNLQKGQSTTYHLKLTGLNGLPGSAWGSTFFPSDLIAPSDLAGGSPSSSRTGTITLTITNGSPGVISMKNVYTVLDAQSFAPSGTFQVDGGVGAILDGGFSILGVARAFLQPVVGFGSYTYPSASLDSAPSGAPFYNPNTWAVNPTAPDAQSSTASTPGLPSCNIPDPPPTILLPLSDLYGKSCMGADDSNLYHQATVGDNAPNDNAPPAKPSREAAEQRAADAEKAAKDWKDRCDKEAAKASAAWMDGYNSVPQSFKDALAKAANDDYHALMDEESARSLVRLDPTDANKAKLEAAKAKSAGTHEAYEAAGNAVRDQFTPTQRAVWENADNEWKSAEYYRAQAEEELRDARDALGRNFPLQPSLKYMF